MLPTLVSESKQKIEFSDSLAAGWGVAERMGGTVAAEPLQSCTNPCKWMEKGKSFTWKILGTKSSQ